MAQALLTPSYFKPAPALVQGCSVLVRWTALKFVAPWETVRRFSAVINQLQYTGDPVIMGMFLSPGGMPRAAVTLVFKAVETHIRRRRTIRLPG